MECYLGPIWARTARIAAESGMSCLSCLRPVVTGFGSFETDGTLPVG